ncbi:MAG: hypothetical protein WD966_05785, partial [Nitrosopumilaceae archaeon]
MRSSILIVFFIGLLIIGSNTSVFGAQLEARIVPDAESAKIKIIFQRNIFIDYKNGGDLANELKTKTWKVNVQADSSNPAVQDLINKLNQKIKNDGSNGQITDLGVEYSAELIGRETNTSIDYKIVLTPTLSHYNIRKYSSNTPSLVDMGWRGLSVIGPITIDGAEINMPISVLKSKEPAAYEIIAGTEGESLLSQNIMNADGIRDQPLGNWHDLFDATGINVDASTFGLDKSISGFVVHTFTMGESSIREGRQVEKELVVTFTKDMEYTIRAVESADSATIAVIGFGAIDNLGGSEVLGVTPNAPKDYGETTGGGFPIMIIYGMAALAGIGAIAILIFSSRKLKAEEGQGQRGIDPSQLQSYSTSASAGGYQTDRGEAHLKSNQS